MLLRSERLILRAPAIGDADAILGAIKETYSDLRKYMPWVKADHALPDVVAYIEHAHKSLQDRSEFPAVLFDQAGAFVGAAGVVRIDWRIPKGEIGYWIRSSRQGEGYATEAARRLVGFAHDELHLRRIEIITSESNAKSWAVAEKLGFKLEAKMPLHRVNADGAIDGTRIYAVVIA